MSGCQAWHQLNLSYKAPFYTHQAVACFLWGRWVLEFTREPFLKIGKIYTCNFSISSTKQATRFFPRTENAVFMGTFKSVKFPQKLQVLF